MLIFKAAGANFDNNNNFSPNFPPPRSRLRLPRSPIFLAAARFLLSSCFFFPPPERCPLSICRFNATGSRWARLIDGALLESPVSRTHTHAAACTDERAATYTSENELWVKIGRVRKSTFHFQRTSSCATSRGHLRPPLSPSFVLFPPPAVLSLSPPPLFSEALPHSPPLQPPEVSVRFGTDAIPPCFNDRPQLQLFLTRAGYRGIASDALSVASFGSVPLVAFSR